MCVCAHAHTHSDQRDNSKSLTDVNAHCEVGRNSGKKKTWNFPDNGWLFSKYVSKNISEEEQNRRNRKNTTIIGIIIKLLKIGRNESILTVAVKEKITSEETKRIRADFFSEMTEARKQHDNFKVLEASEEFCANIFEN